MGNTCCGAEAEPAKGSNQPSLVSKSGARRLDDISKKSDKLTDSGNGPQQTTQSDAADLRDYFWRIPTSEADMEIDNTFQTSHDSEEENIGTELDSVEENRLDLLRSKYRRMDKEPADVQIPTKAEIVVDHPIVSNAPSNNRSCGCFPDEPVVDDTPSDNEQIMTGRFVEGQFETGPHPASGSPAEDTVAESDYGMDVVVPETLVTTEAHVQSRIDNQLLEN